MAKKDVSMLVSAAGWSASFIGELIPALRERGVSDEEIHSFVKREGRPSVNRIADMLAADIWDIRDDLRDNKFLRPASPPLIIDPVDGREVLADASDVFSQIDVDFRKWRTDKTGTAQDKISVVVYDAIEKASIIQFFNSLGDNKKSFCLHQDQIKGFIRKHRRWLRTDGYGTFFLFQAEDSPYGNFFTAIVNFCSHSELRLSIRATNGCDGIWVINKNCRFVAPQIKLEDPQQST